MRRIAAPNSWRCISTWPGRLNQLDARVEAVASSRVNTVMRLMTYPGLGPVTALATEVFLGEPVHFANGKALASYVRPQACASIFQMPSRLANVYARVPVRTMDWSLSVIVRVPR